MKKRSILKKDSTLLWSASPFDFPKDKDGAIYVRQSSMAQVLKNVHSFEMQTDKFLEYFRHMGCTGEITLITDDEALSGTLDIHVRPGMVKLLKLVEEGSIGWIGAIHVNRLTRDPWLITPAFLMKKCYDYNVWIATLRMNFNFKDEYCQRVFMLEAEESARHLKWMKLVLGGGKQTASDNGYYDGRFTIPGFFVDRSDLKRKKYAPYRPHAEIVCWLFRRFLELDGNFAQLCREVEALPYLFPPFESWVNNETISRFRLKPIPDGPYKGCYKPKAKGLASILCNPVYIGWWIPINGGCVENNHEAIVPEGLFIFAHKRLSIHDFEGNRQKPERITRNGKVYGLLKRVLRNSDDVPFYAQPDSGGVYKCMRATGLVYDYQLSVQIGIIDPLFREKFFEHLQTWDGAEGWVDTVGQLETTALQKEQTLLGLIEQAQQQWQEAMDTLKDPTIPKTQQMKLDLATTCQGIEEKIAQLQKDLNQPREEHEEDTVTQYHIYTLLPDLFQYWEKVSFDTRLKFISAMTRKVIIRHVAPVWLEMEIRWKLPDWGRDVAYIRRRAYKAAWLEKEKEVIRELYSHADALELLTRLPERTWNAIKVQAELLGIVRQRGSNTSTAHREYATLSVRDVEFIRDHRLTLNGKDPQWRRLCACR